MHDQRPETLLDVIDQLTIEHPYTARIEGRAISVRREPLIRLLRDAITSSLTGGNGLAASTSKVPFDADALEQYDTLEAEILTELANISDTVPHLKPEDNLRAWYVTYMAGVNPTTDRWVDRWNSWVTRIEAKITAPIVLELINPETKDPYPCPECGFGWFEKVLNSGPNIGRPGRWFDKEKRVALTATYRPDGQGGLEKSGVECGCCGWKAEGSSGVRAFAWDLDHPPTPETPGIVTRPRMTPM